jgi:hypothetical protein
MNLEDAKAVVRAGMQGVIERASVEPVEEDILRRANGYVDEIDAGDWDDGIEQIYHALGWFDCQLSWWRAMSEPEQDYVRYYRAVLSAHKLPERPTARSFSATAEKIGAERKWRFSTVGRGRDTALAFGEAYDALPGVLKSDVKPRGKAGGRKGAT